MTKETAESCVTHNTQKLTSTLFTWTADPKYADTYMNTFYNAVLATQNYHTGSNVYHLPLGSPRVKAFLKENDFRCCNATSIEAFASLNSGIYYHSGTDLWVNLYIPSKLNWTDQNIVLEQSGDFPSDSSAEFTVSAKKKTSILIYLFPIGQKKLMCISTEKSKKRMFLHRLIIVSIVNGKIMIR